MREHLLMTIQVFRYTTILLHDVTVLTDLSSTLSYVIPSATIIRIQWALELLVKSKEMSPPVGEYSDIVYVVILDD